jgi:HSP20 family protein
MTDTGTKLPLKKEQTPPSSGLFEWHPFDTLRRQVNTLFEEFPLRKSMSEFEPFERFMAGWPATPPVDFVEKDKEYEITAELPGLDEKNVEVKLANGTLTIGGEKKDEKEEKREGYHFSERRYGSFKRSFRVPDDVEADKIEAAFEKGVLKIRLPKTAEALKNEKKIEITSK